MYLTAPYAVALPPPVPLALEMRSCQKELERVEAQLEKRGQEMSELQARLQDAEKILVSINSIASYPGSPPPPHA